MKPASALLSVCILALGALTPQIRPAHAAAPPGPPPPPCDPADGYLCNQQGPEDLVPLGRDWAVASAMAGKGGITLIRLLDQHSFTAYPSPDAREQHDRKTYPRCPGPPRGEFTTHGVYVAPGDGPSHKLFVVGHGARESVEVFNVDTSAGAPVLTWIGCAVAPDPVGLNSVRGMPDGGFLATNFLPRGQPITSLMNGANNGEVWEWHTRTGWQKVPGSEASGANGIEMSRDGKTLWVAAWGSQSLFRLSRGASPPVRTEVNLGFRIDNIHWARDGRLLAAGQVGQDWRVVKIDPATLAVEELYAQGDRPGFGGGTVALEVGDTLWVGSYRGDRIAVIGKEAVANHTAITGVTRAWIDAFNRKDQAAIAALYAPDAVFFGTSSPALRDRPELVREYFTGLATLGDSVIALGDHRVQVYGDTAIDTGFYTRTQRADGKETRSPARFTFVYAKRDGRWVIVNHHSSALPAAP